VGEFVDVGISGSRDRRPELEKLVKLTHRGKVDIVVCWKFDRFARSVRHLVTALDDFGSKGIDFVSACDAVDTTSAGGRFMFHILGAVAELERELIRERTVAGLAAAKRRGKKLGRRAIRLDKDQLLELRGQGLSVRAIAEQMGVSKSLVARTLKSVHESPLDLVDVKSGKQGDR
jgi:DNA invertase Pin-like site-specific DNA recombinase